MNNQQRFFEILEEDGVLTSQDLRILRGALRSLRPYPSMVRLMLNRVRKSQDVVKNRQHLYLTKKVNYDSI